MIHLNPVTKKRLKRFKELKRAYLSFWLLLSLYGISLIAPIIANDKPLYVSHNGKSYFPIFKFYPEDIFTDSGKMTRADFKEIQKSAAFSENPDNKIIFKHILPNAMIPIITFAPFSLVGAIGSLAALDYLGFGLPAASPSWGDLLRQAQEQRDAWWLIAYPSLALFTVMLLGVFIGEGVRNAFDPKRFSNME